MNIADIFYIVAIICMVTVTGTLLLVGLTIIRLIRSVGIAREQVLYRLRNFKIAQYSLQLTALRMVMNFLQGFSKNKGGERT